MTIIVYSNEVIAADTQLVVGDLKWSHMKKITKNEKGTLAGASGHASFVQEFLTWVDEGENDTPPKSNITNQAILITSKKQIFYHAGKVPIRIKERYIVIGSGMNVALGALWMNATAIQAVEAAMHYTNNCGGKVDFLEL